MVKCDKFFGKNYEEGVLSGLYPFDPYDFFPGEIHEITHFCGDKGSMVVYDVDGCEYFCHLFTPLSIGAYRAKKCLSDYACVKWVQTDVICRICSIRNFCRPCFGWRMKLRGNIMSCVERETLCRPNRALAKFSALRFLREFESAPSDLVDSCDITRARNSIRYLKECEDESRK